MASMQVEGEIKSCQRIVENVEVTGIGVCQDSPPQPKPSGSSNYVNKIVRVTTRQKQRIRVKDFANLLQLCECTGGGLNIRQTPHIDSISIDESVGKESGNVIGATTAGAEPCACACHNESDGGRCIVLKYSGPIISFPCCASCSSTAQGDNNASNNKGDISECQQPKTSASTSIFTGLTNNISRNQALLVGATALVLLPLAVLPFLNNGAEGPAAIFDGDKNQTYDSTNMLKADDGVGNKVNKDGLPVGKDGKNPSDSSVSGWFGSDGHDPTALDDSGNPVSFSSAPALKCPSGRCGGKNRFY